MRTLAQPGARRATRHHRTAFTLAELLAVIAIIGIMIAASAPSITSLMRGAGVRGATTQLKSGLSLARQYAITHRTPVYVVLPVWANDPQANDPNKSKGYRSFGICSFTATTDTNGITSTNFSYIQDWQVLPQGVLLQTNSTGFTTTNLPASCGLTSPIVLAFCFKTDGSLRSVGSSTLNLSLREGYLNNSGTPILRNNGFSNQVSIYGLTGTVKVQ